jgi:hypothetical protein
MSNRTKDKKNNNLTGKEKEGKKCHRENMST